MDTEEVFSCSLQESYYGINEQSFVKPPLLSHTPDYNHMDANVSQNEDEVIGTPLLYSIQPLSNVEDDIFTLDQDFSKDIQIPRDYDNTSTEAVLISDFNYHMDTPVYSIPQENYRLWLQKF